jgi:photolyase PhrII
MESLASALPAHLRLRIPGSRETLPAEGFVLYWMRSAVRGHENPALDVAMEAARELGAPLLVYHALSERYPYASFRHHAFILQGARDAHRELLARGIPAVFHLERPGHDGPWLLRLAAAARLVVTEAVPIPFLRRWTATVREATRAPVVEVDASTLASVYQVDRRAVDRAFRFRKGAAPLWERWLQEPWPQLSAGVEAPGISLPFEPLPVAEADDDALRSWVASCRVDPAVAPVPHTPGGSVAGYARWEHFRDGGGLARYARDRNDPLRQGVSRMSAYLHYGHVSPFRVAREARQFRDEARAAGREEDARGAEKYLDELLTWRELAWCWCHHQEDPESLDALPGWARATLEAHAEDPRPHLHDRETLARGRTGDPLWDAAQQSLLVHGELHNNVRMTWGKALLAWTPGPAEALAALVELNHRYALDGRDPGSYGGLLWCLGAFDRPFEPEIPVLGRVRPRDPATHARRLDPVAWGRETGRPVVASPPSVAVVGGGVAGLAAARVLADHGIRVRVFDKGRGVGGRISTRLRDGWAMDHGAPFFTARDPAFRRAVQGWAQAGVVAPWTGRIGYLRSDGTLEPATEATRWVGVPEMREVARHLEASLQAAGPAEARGWHRDVEVRTGVEVAPLESGPLPLDALAGGGRWALGGEHFHAVIITAPPPQAARLLAGVHPELARQVEGLGMRPSLSVMLRVADGARLLPADALFFEDHPVFRWVARDTSKPGRRSPDGAEHWVLHASAPWSEAHLEDDPAAVASTLVAALERVVSELAGEAAGGRAGAQSGEAAGEPADAAPSPAPAPAPTLAPRVLEAVAHRWRYASPADPRGAEPPFLWDAEAGLGVAGDALGGGRVEGAFRSGAGLAGRILLGLTLGSPEGFRTAGGWPPR